MSDTMDKFIELKCYKYIGKKDTYNFFLPIKNILRINNEDFYKRYVVDYLSFSTTWNFKEEKHEFKNSVRTVYITPECYEKVKKILEVTNV